MSDSDLSTPDAPAALSVESDLSLLVNGGEADVESTGKRLLVRFRSLPDVMRATRGLPAGTEGRFSALLTTADLTVEVRSRDRTVAVVGVDARPGVLSGLLGVDPVEVRVGGVLGALGAEVAALT